MPVPLSPADVPRWAAEIEQRLAKLENPGSPTLMFAMASTKLTTVNAAAYTNCQVFATDLKCPAISNGVHWYRSDTGALIV